MHKWQGRERARDWGAVAQTAAAGLCARCWRGRTPRLFS